MSYLVCAAEDCKQPFEPAFGQEETQKFCSVKCRNRDGVRRYRARLKPKPNGGGPGGRRQPMLFPVSTLRSKKPAKAAMKPKQDALFPADVRSWFAALTAEQRQEVLRIAAEDRGREGAVSDNANSADGQILCKLTTMIRPVAAETDGSPS
jgi:hypothetical protein